MPGAWRPTGRLRFCLCLLAWGAEQQHRPHGPGSRAAPPGHGSSKGGRSQVHLLCKEPVVPTPRGQSPGVTMTLATEGTQGWGVLGEGEGPRGTSTVEQLWALLWARGGWLWPPRPSAPLQPAAFAEHPQQSPGNIRAEGEPQMWRQLWAWSPCWAASVGRAGALPHRLQGRGLRPPPPAPNRIPGSVRTSPAPISHRGDAHARPLSEPCGGCGAVGWCQAEPFERLEKSSSPRAGGRASCLTEVRKSL